jgi:predicted transcriptional regulator
MSKSDYNLFEFFMKNVEDDFDTEELAKKTGFHITTVQRTVKKMHEKGLLSRKQKNLGGGGYIFVYQLQDKKRIRQIVISTVQLWTKRVEEEVNHW